VRRYVVTLLIIAFLVGTLFKATEQTGMRIWNMFATMGIFLFGLVGSLALTRMQRRSGQKSVETALKALEPEWVITDWAGEGGDKPDYLLVGPTGIAVICVDETAGSTFAWRARQLVERSCRRAEQSAEWVRSRLGGEAPVMPVVLLTRRKVEPEYGNDQVAVLNPDQLAEHLRSGDQPALYDQPTRFRLTRLFREGQPGGKAAGDQL
jgi:hypothetical protein